MRNANYDVKLLQLCILTSIFSQIESNETDNVHSLDSDSCFLYSKKSR